jgi:hypothetical protein
MLLAVANALLGEQNPGGLRRLIGFLKTHPFWTLLIVVLVIGLVQLVLFVPGHGSGGMDLGPIQQDK